MRTTPHLTRPQLRQLTDELRVERARFERVIERHVTRGDADGDARAGDSSEEMTSGAPQSPAHDEARLRRESLDAALRRVEAGDYGACVACAAPIPFGRLLAMPDATRCVTCAARG